MLFLLLSCWLPIATATGLDDSTRPNFGIDTSSITATDTELPSTSGIANDATVDAMVDDLNSRYANGKPSDDYGEIGIVLRMIDGVCVGASCVEASCTCDHNMAHAPTSAFFGGTVDGINDLVSASYNKMINSPESIDFGDEIYIFPSWSSGFGPAAGLVYYPCAAEKSTRCMWPTDAASDQRPLSCGRCNPFGFEINHMSSIPGCTDCMNENPLSAEDNTVNGRTIHRLDDLPTEANVSSYEIELLLNRANKKTVDSIVETSGTKTWFSTNLSESCDLCESNFVAQKLKANSTRDDAVDGIYGTLFYNEYRWFEAPGYYGTLAPEDDTSVIKPRNELKQMLEAQLEYFGANHDYSEMGHIEFFKKLYQVGLHHNEWAIDGNVMSKLEEDRAQQDDPNALDFEGNDTDGKCGAAIKALVMVCGDQDDPFYYGEHGQCLDFAEVYKKNFGTDVAPPVVYFNQKNFTHPFSSTCDVEVSCGVENTDAAGSPPDSDSRGDSSGVSSSAGLAAAGFVPIYLASVVLSIIM